MNWLSGKPQRVISLLLPGNHPLGYSYGSWSVLDDQVLHTFTVRDPDQQSSAIYLAKLYEIAQAGQGTTTAAFVKIATLPNAVHRVALLPDRAGFISLEFTRETSSIMLRIHNWDGTISKEKYAHAAAAYGNLVVNRHSVAICISSGQPSPEEVLTGNPSGHHRVDASDFRASSRPEILTGDHILVWTFNSNTLTSVQIPQDEAPALHDASFQFVGDSHIALGGTLSSCYGTPSALLKAFRVDNRDKSTRTFAHGDNFECESDIGCIAIPGSSGNNAVLVNYHHDGRVTVMANGLVSGDIDSQPNSDDPPGLHFIHDHPGFSRTIPGAISEFLPSISDNRLLVGRRIDFDEEGFKKFAIEPPHVTGGTILFLYDFDQVRCNELLNTTAEQRISLESALREENANAQVSVVERNFSFSIEGEDEDKEWPPGDEWPQEWIAHVDKLDEIGVARIKGTAEVPVLEFDEAPHTQKQNSRILFTRSAVWLPEDTDIRAIGLNDLALTTSGIVHMPNSFGKVGHFFCFADS